MNGSSISTQLDHRSVAASVNVLSSDSRIFRYSGDSDREAGRATAAASVTLNTPAGVAAIDVI
jgi:hypothetical protein